MEEDLICDRAPVAARSAPYEQEQKDGVNAGIWEVVAELAIYHRDTAGIVISNLQPELSGLQSVSLEALADVFGSERQAMDWVHSFTGKGRKTDYAELSKAVTPHPNNARMAFNSGQNYGIGEAYLAAMQGNHRAVMHSMDRVVVPLAQMHPSTIKRAEESPFDQRFKQLMK